MFISAYKQLRPAHKAFVDMYVTQAEREAERRHERISLALHKAVTAEDIEASDGMLQLPMVQAAIAERINDLAAAEDFTWQRWLKEVGSVAFASVDNYIDVQEDGSAIIDLTKASPEALAAIKSCETEETGDPMAQRGRKRKVKITMHDKLPALKMMQEFYEKIMEYAPHLMPAPRNVLVEHDAAALPAGVTVEQAAARYAAEIE